MKTRHSICFAVIAILTGPPIFATSFAPYPNQRITDTNGRYYVVVERKPGDSGRIPRVTLTIAEQRAGSPAVAPAQMAIDGGPDRVFSRYSDVRLRDGDTVHARIELDQPPNHILVSSDGKGIVTVDKYGFNSREQDAVVVYSTKGQVLHRKDRKDLFDADTRGRFIVGNGYVSWLDCAWLDDKRGQLVVVARARDRRNAPPLITVQMSSGEVRSAGTEVIDRAIAERNASALPCALRLADEWKLANSRPSWNDILTDKNMPLEQRLQTAVLLNSVGDRGGVELVKKTALESAAKKDVAAQLHAVRLLPTLFGDDAAAIVCEWVRRFGKKGYHSAWTAMQEIRAEAAIPELRKMMAPSEAAHSQLFAIGCVRLLGADAKLLVPDLIQILEREPQIQDKGLITASTHTYAASELARIGSEAQAALPALIRHAQATAPSEWARVKDRQPPPGTAISANRYSENEFIEAICQIRK